MPQACIRKILPVRPPDDVVVSDSPSVAEPQASSLESRHRDVRRVTLLGSALDLVLGVAKLLGGWFGHSQSLIADGVHSLSDLATDVAVLIAAKHAHAEADEEHPYGHARIETAATVGLGAVLVLTGVGIGFDAVSRLFGSEPLDVPAVWALSIALVSVVSKELMYHYTMRYARRLDSPMLRANAWHTRSDAASSIVVIIGIGGALLGFAYLDAVAAIVVGVFIAKIGYGFAASSFRELVDTGLKSERLQQIRDIALATPGVHDLHMLRTRRMGGKAFVDVHIILADGKISVSEGHFISEGVRARLIKQMSEVEDVTVHIDPEDDEINPRIASISRVELEERVRDALRRAGETAAPGRLTLHYLAGHVQADVELPITSSETLENSERITAELEKLAEAEPALAKIRLVYAPVPSDTA